MLELHQNFYQQKTAFHRNSFIDNCQQFPRKNEIELKTDSPRSKFINPLWENEGVNQEDMSFLKQTDLVNFVVGDQQETKTEKESDI